jgi:hypothetical protein
MTENRKRILYICESPRINQVVVDMVREHHDVDFPGGDGASGDLPADQAMALIEARRIDCYDLIVTGILLGTRDPTQDTDQMGATLLEWARRKGYEGKLSVYEFPQSVAVANNKPGFSDILVLSSGEEVEVLDKAALELDDIVKAICALAEAAGPETSCAHTPPMP